MDRQLFFYDSIIVQLTIPDEAGTRDSREEYLSGMTEQ